MVPTPEERDAFAWMQGRMVELLLRHDVQRFGEQFGERVAELLADERLEHYRRLAVFFYLRDELFGTILPRIKRRLSFAAPREVLVEELPPRGRIDWARTAAAGLRERPGEVPLEVRTRQRRRHFATPENLLTVITLLEYRRDTEKLLAIETDRNADVALLHPLHEILESCTRELAFLQFAGLISTCETIMAGYAAETVEQLEQAVADNLQPGRNSAYDDLLLWRERLSSLQLLDRVETMDLPPMLGTDPERDNYLYQLWLFYELADLLQGKELLDDWRIGEMQLSFRWGVGAEQRAYLLQHDQGIPRYWSTAPGIRPDLYIARSDRREVRYNNTLYWQAPGYVLDAKYYKPRDKPKAPGNPIKRMIADLALTNERHGALLFAFQRSEQAQGEGNAELELDTNQLLQTVQPLYQVQPDAPAALLTPHESTIGIWRTQPALPSDETNVAIQDVLCRLLDHVHAALKDDVAVACHGVFLDTLSAEGRTLVGRFGETLTPASDLLVCPKPHIGPGRIDLVSRAQHCCKDPRLCHIAGQQGAQPPVRPPRSAEELLEELQHVFTGEGQAFLPEETVSIVAQRVEELTRRFAAFVGADKRLGVYENRLRDMGLDHVLHLLGDDERKSLALAVFLVEQLDLVNAHDFSAPAIHISSVIELEVQRRVFGCPNLVGSAANPKKQTLGVLPYMRRNADDTEGDWERIVTYVAAHWHEQVDPDDPGLRVSFEAFVNKALNRISQLRNQAAHTHPVSRREYTELQKLTFQHGPLGYGALPALLLAWKEV